MFGIRFIIIKRLVSRDATILSPEVPYTQTPGLMSESTLNITAPALFLFNYKAKLTISAE